MADDVLVKYEELKKRFEQAGKGEAVARSQVEQAAQLVAKAEATLRELGLDPEKAEEQLAEKLVALDAEVTKCRTEVEAAIASHAAIDAAFRQMGA